MNLWKPAILGAKSGACRKGHSLMGVSVVVSF